jgi:hypothetical protein
MMEARQAVCVPFLDLRSSNTELAVCLDEAEVGTQPVRVQAGANR